MRLGKQGVEERLVFVRREFGVVPSCLNTPERAPRYDL